MGTLLKPTLEITNCRQCPYKIETNHSSSDGWDRMEDWECTGITGNKTIQHGVEWHEEDKIEVPKWCPLRIKRN